MGVLESPGIVLDFFVSRRVGTLVLVQFFIVLLLIRATFCIFSLSWYIFCLLVVLVKVSVLSK